MNRDLRFAACSLFLCWLLVLPSLGATHLDPALKWRTIETLHFKITYHDGLEEHAKRMASIAEETHSRLTPLFRYVPSMKTDVVLLDNTDFSNGLTSVFPNPLIIIYVADIGSNYQPYAYEEWLRYVFVHEYTHLLNLETIQPSAHLIRGIFGRMFFPNTLAPMFIIEGYATYMETLSGRGGRGDAPRWNAMMRMDALENDFKSIEQASVRTVRWPMGSVPYLYGVHFFQYLDRKYGAAKIYELSQYYGEYLFSGGIDSAFKHVFGSSLQDLWADWQKEEVRKAEEMKAEIKKEPLTMIARLTSGGYYSLKPRWGDPDTVYFTEVNPEETSHISKISVSTGRTEKVVEGRFFDDRMGISGGKLYYSKADVFRNFYFFKDIYERDLESGREKRLTRGARAADPDVDRDGLGVVHVRNHAGSRTLWLNDRQLVTSEAGTQFFSPAFSPDGKKVAAARWIRGEQKIIVIDASSGTFEYMSAADLSIEANPCFSPDGKYLLFDSDMTGVPNIYACELSSRRVYKVTNVLGMAVMPCVSPDGRDIVFVNYSSKGNDLALIPFDPSSWKEVNWRPSAPQPPPLPGQDHELVLRAYDYDPLPTFVPKFWIPYSFGSENGRHMLAYTAGTDALGQHTMLMYAGFDWTSKRAQYRVTYNNNQFLPQLTVSLSDTAVPYLWDGGARTYWDRERHAALYCTFFSNRVFSEFDRQSFSFGLEGIRLSGITSTEPLVVKPSSGTMLGYYLGYRYSSSRMYPRSVAPEQGTDIGVHMRLYTKDLGSDFNMINYSADASRYIGTPIRHHILALKAAGDLRTGDHIVQGGFSYRSYRFRGYPGQTFPGTKFAAGKVEYLFPVSYMESGLGYGSLFFDRLFGVLFFEQGGAAFGPASIIDLKRGYGAELTLKTIDGWGMIPLDMTLGYAKGVDAGGEEQMYFLLTL